METEIDPLSILEQTMHVNDYSVTSNGDEDIVCLNDDQDPVVVEVPDDNEQNMEYCLPPDPDNPIVLGTMPNGTVILDTMRNDIAVVMELPQSLPQGLEEDAMGFGDHFLASPGPSSVAVPVASTNKSESTTPITPNDPKINGRGRGSRGPRAIRSSGKIKRGGKISVAPVNGNQKPTTPHISSVITTKPLEDIMSTTISNEKLVNNVKRLSFVSNEEQSYRYKIFKEFQKVLRSRLDCTVCGLHIGCSVELNVFNVTHPLLKVLACINCKENYCSTDWTLGPESKDVRCRWCSSPASFNTLLKNCSNCPFAFCDRCIIRNYSKRDCSRIMNNSIWLCFVCQMVPLYYLRATCWALNLFIASLGRRKNRSQYIKDLSLCCTREAVPINVEEEDEVQPVPEPVHTVSCQAVASRIDVLFTSVDTIKNAVKMRLGTPIEINKLEDTVSSINLSLAKIGRNVESCLQYIESWRIHSLEEHRKSVVEKAKAVKVKRLNGSQNYSYLLKKFNIKPCSVLLERIDSHVRKETSQPPNFFLSLIPSTSEEINIIDDDDDDDDIICLDD